jgi:ketose-bisphosphate aldolase
MKNRQFSESSVLQPSLKLAKQAMEHGYAVPAFCAWNAESMAAILAIASRMQAPVILMQGPLEFPVLNPSEMAAVAAQLAKCHCAVAALHLDHGNSMQLVETCIESGYTSVMLDYSTRPFEENIAALREVVSKAHPLGISVEGEIGTIGKEGASTREDTTQSVLTDPEQAQDYVRRTGVDMLAVSIGNKHGFYQGEPNLNFDLLSRIRSTVSVPLVLHGGTGIPEADIKKAISLGIAKINVASELIHAFRKSLMAQWTAERNLWLSLACAEAKQELEGIIVKWITTCAAEGKVHV